MRTPYATDAQLAWFNIENYPSCLADHHLSVEQWIDLLEDRLLIQRAFRARSDHPALLDRARELFGHVQSAPLVHRNTKTLRFGQPHSTDTPTVSCLRAAELRDCAVVAESEGLADEGLYSLPGEAAREGYAGFHALVLVDLSARNSTLEANFKTWVRNMRRYVQKGKTRGAKSVVANWERNHYLPYFDLKLFCALYKVSISAEKLVEMLCLRSNGSVVDDADLLDTPKKSLKAFTWQTVKRLRTEVGG